MQDSTRVREPSAEEDRLAHETIGAAIEVHRVLGPGLLKSLYEEALCVELSDRGIPFVPQPAADLTYKERPIGTGRLDLPIGGSVIVELKAVDALADVHTTQVVSYLRMSGHHLGLLINFNVARLRDRIKRLVVSE
jgi:GxxExxY protein